MRDAPAWKNIRVEIPFRKVLWLFLLLSFLPQNHAVIFLGTGDPEHNTTAPTGELAQSGWQFLGDWGSFSGTVIGPKHFVTALHVGGEIGQSFYFNGQAYTTTAFYEVGITDLRIWEICGEFSEPYAPLYSRGDEEGESLVVFGRGTQRGREVWVGSGASRELRGWTHGTWDKRRRWGENVVTLLVDAATEDEEIELGELQYLVVDFDREAGFNESALSGGDSGGAVFIHDGDQWALAGVNVGIEGPFRFEAESNDFSASVFDAGGLFADFGETLGWRFIPDEDFDIPAAFFAARISNYIRDLRQIMDGEVAAKGREPWLVSAETPAGHYQSEFFQVLDEASRSIRVPLVSDTRYFQLQGCQDYQVRGIEVSEESVVIHYSVLD